jgi:hypothetical protein
VSKTDREAPNVIAKWVVAILLMKSAPRVTLEEQRSTGSMGGRSGGSSLLGTSPLASRLVQPLIGAIDEEQEDRQL